MVYQTAFALSPPATDSPVARLARFFPGATSVRIPVLIIGGMERGHTFSEKSVIEFGTPDEVLFASSLPMDYCFGDRLRIENSDGSFRTEAQVIAVQVHEGRTAVAARFINPVRNWIIKQ